MALAPPAGILLLWQALAWAGMLEQGLFSSPAQVFSDMLGLERLSAGGKPVLLGHFLATLRRLLLGSLIGISLGIVAGVLMGLFDRLNRLLSPVLAVILPIPGIAMAPLFIIWMGFGDGTIVAIGAVASFFPLAYNASAGVRSVDRRLVRAALVMGVRGPAMVLHVYVPWAAIHILTGVRQGLARCWRTVVAVELVAATGLGMGYMIWDAAEHLRVSVVFGGIILLGITFTVIDKGLMAALERATVRKWGMVGR